jgi:creatinine amidohydrolase
MRPTTTEDTTVRKVRYEDMLPHEIVAARRAKPVAYLPLGGLEWHGEHMAVGNDALKAQRLCELAAERGGGLAMPPLWYGEPRVERLMETNADDKDKIIKTMKLRPADFATGKKANPFGTSGEEQIALYQALLRHTFVQIRTLGFKAIVVLTGHYPLYDWAQPVAQEFNKAHKDCRIFVGIEFHYDVPAVGKGKVGGDHAAKWETSYLMALRPECVDMTVFSGRPANEPLIGVGGEDPRVHATKQVGVEACDLIVKGMIKQAEKLLKNVRS